MTDDRRRTAEGGGRSNLQLPIYDLRFWDSVTSPCRRDEHRMLVVLKAQLYDGMWEPMLDDLRNRLTGKPYIFKLANRIKEDIRRIEEMQEFEDEHNIDLADYVKM